MPSCCLSVAVCLLLGATPTHAPPAQKSVLTPAAWMAGSQSQRPCFLPHGALPTAEEDYVAEIPQEQAAAGTEPTAKKAELPEQDRFTFFSHPDTTRYWISGQENTIYQMHGNFHSPYQGPNSFTAPFQYKASVVGTLMLGYQLNTNPRYETEVFYDEESAGGRGLSQAFGLAGFTNLDVVRNPNLGLVPYLARAEIHQTIGFTNETTPQDRGPFSLATSVPVRRIEFRAGKLGLPDILDQNAVLTDSHQQFMDWTVDNNGAWDYAADTRGYTYGADFEYQDRNWGARYVLALMPTVANGINLDWALRRARAQNGELEIRKGFLPGRHGRIRLLAYGNNAHMGDYREAVIHYFEGITPKPEITSVEQFGTLKYGIDFNVEQNITDNLRVGGRFGWNEGQHESFAYTEDDQTFLFGGDYAGSAQSG